jgi:hypothetical protein
MLCRPQGRRVEQVPLTWEGLGRTRVTTQDLVPSLLARDTAGSAAEPVAIVSESGGTSMCGRCLAAISMAAARVFGFPWGTVAFDWGCVLAKP